MNFKLILKSSAELLKKRGLEDNGRVQKYIDSEVIRKGEAYVPLLSGVLKGSAILHSKIGSGRVSYKTPYAKRQYYRGRAEGTSRAGALRGRYWFERMKITHKAAILDGAKKKAGEK